MTNKDILGDIIFFERLHCFTNKWNKKYQAFFKKDCRSDIAKIILDNMPKYKNYIDNNTLDNIFKLFDKIVAADFQKYTKN